MVERMGSTDVPDVVQAKRFELVDDNGNVRARLAMADDGTPYLDILDQNGQDRLVVRLY